MSHSNLSIQTLSIEKLQLKLTLSAMSFLSHWYTKSDVFESPVH
jgi:hypothetical protein